MRRLMLSVIFWIVLGSLSGCGGITETMGPTEVGVRYRDLPYPIGGISSKVISPGQLAFIFWPFDKIFRFDTAVKDVSWPAQQGEGADVGEDSKRSFVNTRALDGNEVALSVTVRYRVTTDPEKLLFLIQNAATSDSEVRELVISVARADIRNHMNKLKTSDFLDELKRYEAVDAVRAAMAHLLEPYGIEIPRVILDDFRFERLLRDGTVDASYQDKLTEIQKTREDTERERSRIETVKAKKQEQFNMVQATVNRTVAEAQGYKKQAVLKGDGFYEAKINDAKGILALGKAEVEGLVQQIEALSGPGGQAILKLEIARQLLRGNPRFVVLNQGSSAMSVQRIDANDLLAQMGLLEGLKDSVGGNTPVKGSETKSEARIEEKNR